MATITSERKPTTIGFETTGIEQVAETDRAHTQIRDTLWLWWSANSIVATVVLVASASKFDIGAIPAPHRACPHAPLAR